MPDTPLTDILKDFRSYRPGNHRDLLEWVGDKAQDIGVKVYSLKKRSSAGKEIDNAMLSPLPNYP